MKSGIKIFDAHMHYAGIFSKEKSIIEYMDNNRIDAAIMNTLNLNANMGVLGSMNIEGLKENIYNDKFELFKDFRESGQPDHSKLEKLQNKYPDRIFPFFWYNPNDPNDIDQTIGLKKVTNAFKNGFKGIKLQPAMIPFEIQQLFPIAKVLTDANLPLYIHPCSGVFGAKRTKPLDLIPLIREFPELKLIIGHCAFSMEFVIEMISIAKILSEISNTIYFETSVSIPFGILSYIKVFGPDRVLFGSDSPPAGPWQIEFNKVNMLNIPINYKKKIFSENIIRILNLDELE